MTKQKVKEIRQMSKEQLIERIAELRKDLLKLNAQIAIGTIPESPGKVKQIKKTIARMLTILNEKNTLERKEETKPKEETKKQ